MRRLLSLCCSATFLVGCAGSGDGAADSAAGATAAAAPAATPAAPALSLADVAGKWNVRVMAEGQDSVLSTYVLTATADTTGWTITFPNREPIPVRNVVVDGDSITTEAGPFPSSVRKGATVRNVRTVSRLQGGNLVGTAVATYEGSGPDSVARLRSEGTRAP